MKMITQAEITTNKAFPSLHSLAILSVSSLHSPPYPFPLPSFLFNLF